MDMLSAMRIFTRVVERGSFSAVARDLGLGQPTVSERIGLLEKHLAVKLLYRTTRSVQATDVGMRFYAHAKQAIEAAEAAEASVIPPGQSLTGTFRIAAPHGLGEVTLPKLLIEFQERNPGLKINLTLNDNLVDPVTEGVDLSIRIGEIGCGNYIARRLGTVRRLLLAAPGYIQHHGQPYEPADLIQHPFIRIDRLSTNERLNLTTMDGCTVGVPIHTSWCVNHWRPLLEAILAEKGIGALHSTVCSQEVADGKLIQIMPSYHFRALEAHALYPPGLHPSAKASAFLTLLSERRDEFLGIQG
ncbi:LysR family transcriptional regulator [Kosakonia oryziphila]|uniref:DNA-binding transcriptional regulator, LysR family n=1 Tax=Kosakonia oryziphila TaxID=1005667 RepID=A0A1C4D8P9_9ENTR|nr:LysR family transcriptional regulator [Kosakonia oryziphila]SCC27703.1 DNA-binding transcriptional regulator, LysR family [Kosakonia oryziphila]